MFQEKVCSKYCRAAGNLHLVKGVFPFQGRVRLQVALPYGYPHAAPQLVVRSDALARQQQSQLNEDLASHMASLEPGELGMWTALLWLQENNTLPIARKAKAVKTFFNGM